jgi:hypothetical protein
MAPVPLALALVPLLALVGGATADAPAYEIDVADISNAPDACPSQEQVADILDVRLPGILTRPGHEPGPNLLHLSLSLSPEGVARITMTDATGALRLERDLALPKSEGEKAGRPTVRDRSACATLADTVALIVERYMRHLGYHEPPPPALVAPTPPLPAPPSPPSTPAVPQRFDARARLGAGLSARPPWRASWRLEPGVTGALRFRYLELAASVAAGLPVDQPVPMSDGTGTLKLTTFPARLSVGWALPVGARASVVPAVAGGLDLVLAGTTGIDKTRRSAAVEPTIEAGATALLAVTRRIWADLHVFQGIDVRPEEFQVTNAAGQMTTLFMTPRSYTRLGVDFGVFLGKN